MAEDVGLVRSLIKKFGTAPDPSVIEGAVDNYLEEHPEATCPIDDTAGSGDTGKVWSADKSAGETASLSEAIEELPDIEDSTKTGVDLDVSDESGNVILRLKDGQIETKNFKSKYIRQLTGKKWACIGDSITGVNQRTTVHYHDIIADETGITVVNMGYSGSGFAKVGGDEMNYTDIAGLLTSDIDVVTIMASGNDIGCGKDLGTPTDTGTTTICGCINATLDEVYSILPTKGLGVITSPPWITAEPSDGNGNLSQYCAAIVQICALRGIPCLDLYHCSLLHPDDSSFRALAYSKDEGNGVHPDETGHAMIAPRIRQFLFSLI